MAGPSAGGRRLRISEQRSAGAWLHRVVTLSVLTVAVLLVLSWYASPGRESADTVPVRVGAQAEQAVTTYLGLLSGGAFGPAWDMWTAAAQARVPREAFLTRTAHCAAALGKPYEVVDVHVGRADVAHISWRQDGVSGVCVVRLEGVRWRVDPSDEVEVACAGS